MEQAPTKISPKKKRSFFRKKAFIWPCAILLFLGLLLGGLAWTLQPKRLTPIASRLIDGMFKTSVSFDQLEISLFEDFPYLNINIDNGLIISRAYHLLPQHLRAILPRESDSLLRFDRLSLSLHLPKLLKSEIDIRAIRMQGLKVQAYVAPWGQPNWDVFNDDEDSDENTEEQSFSFHVKRIMLSDGLDVRFDNEMDSLHMQLSLQRLFLRGNITQNLPEIELDRLALSGLKADAFWGGPALALQAQWDTLRISKTEGHNYELLLQSLHGLQYGAQRYADALPLQVEGLIGFDFRRPDSLQLHRLALTTAEIPTHLDGHVVWETLPPRVHMNCRIDSLPLAKLISYIPEAYDPASLHQISSDIAAKIQARIDLPDYSLDISTSGGYLHYPAAGAKVEKLALDVSFRHFTKNSKASGLDIRQCEINATGLQLQVQGRVSDVFGDPQIKLNAQGHTALDSLLQWIPLPDDITARGNLTLQAEADLRLSQLQQGDFQDMQLRGQVTADRLRVRLPKDSIFVMSQGGLLSFGAHESQRDSSLVQKGAQILRASFRSDTTQVRIKRNFHLALAQTRISLLSDAQRFSGDSSRIHPFRGSFESRHMEVNAPDSTWALIRNGKGSFSMAPSAAQANLPSLSLQLQAENCAARYDTEHYALHETNINIQATQLRANNARSQRGRTATDSLQMTDSLRITTIDSLGSASTDSLRTATDDAQSRRSPRLRDSLSQPRNAREQDAFSAGDLSVEIDADTRRLIRQWQIEGSIEADGGSMSTPYFPLPLDLGNTSLEWDSDRLYLMQTEIRAGRSNLRATGNVSNLRQALLGRGDWVVEGFLSADTLDVNELSRAANVGAAYAASGISASPADIDSASSLIIIPANLRAGIKLFADHSHYADLQLQGLSGGLSVQNRNLQIDNLEARSDAGDFKLTALYATRSPKDIVAGFDLEMQKVQVNRLIALMPAIDSLAPMLRSFEGEVSCQLSATSALDVNMNFLLPTLRAACHIRGNNMVLLDGETFTEIAKQLHFNKKARNIIDSISVDFLIHDSKIEVFPFIIEMDRYRAAVSGIHHLDMQFDYHISVLQSPIPFRVGINIYGNFDDLHFSIVRCKYRNSNLPSYVEVIQDTRLNLLQAIRALDPSAVTRSLNQGISRREQLRLTEEEEPQEEPETPEELPKETVIASEAIFF
jgi:Uncharacterized protein conserved in bacteria